MADCVQRAPGAATAEPAKDRPAKRAGGGVGTRVCVVDDDESVRDSFQALLESLGYTVTAYASGGDVLADERRHEAGCFIVDQHMPGMDGLATLDALRRDEPEAAAILITGRLDAGIAARAAALGVCAVLEKPFSAARLLEQIRACARTPRD